MLQVENKTPFVPGLFVFPDADGVDTLYLVVKATFALTAGRVRVADEQVKIVAGDEYRGEPGRSSLRYAGEAHLAKPATDVAVVGSAHAPGGRPASHVDVSLSVGRLRKALRAWGDRRWVMGKPSAPARMASIPLTWERAYGGQQDLGDGKVLSEPYNPVGCGFLGHRGAPDPERDLVPNLELPGYPVRGPGDRVPPAGLGFIAPSWRPRVDFAGTYDEAWQEQRAPYLPADFDPRFLQAVPSDQIYKGYLQGGEPVELVGLSPAGPQRFVLPRCELFAGADVAGTLERPALRIETLLLEPDLDRFSLLWRGSVRCDKRALKIRQVAFGMGRLQGATA